MACGKGFLWWPDSVGWLHSAPYLLICSLGKRLLILPGCCPSCKFCCRGTFSWSNRNIFHLVMLLTQTTQFYLFSILLTFRNSDNRVQPPGTRFLPFFRQITRSSGSVHSRSDNTRERPSEFDLVAKCSFWVLFHCIRTIPPCACWIIGTWMDTVDSMKASCWFFRVTQVWHQRELTWKTNSHWDIFLLPFPFLT